MGLEDYAAEIRAARLERAQYEAESATRDVADLTTLVRQLKAENQTLRKRIAELEGLTHGH